jgi:hypothetical protein
MDIAETGKRIAREEAEGVVPRPNNAMMAAVFFFAGVLTWSAPWFMLGLCLLLSTYFFVKVVWSFDK